MRRRTICLGMLAAPAAMLGGSAGADPALSPFPQVRGLELVAQSPTHLWNGVVVTLAGRIFADMPRWPGYEQGPGLVEVMKDGSLMPYPGGGWNELTPASDPRTTFMMPNALNCFDGYTIWLVDQGNAPGHSPAAPGAQKAVQIDTRTNKVVRVIYFDDKMPVDASLNDIRIHGDWAYFTESELGSIVLVNLRTGESLRRLADDPTTKQVRPKVGHDNRWLVLPNGKPQVTNADPIELSPDGDWLYYQPSSGPLYRVPTAALRDRQLSEAALSKQVEFVYDTPTLGGTAMDSKGNLYLSESAVPRISVLLPDGTLRVLAEDERLWGADGMFITKSGYLYMPMSQVPNLQFEQGPNGKSLVTLPFKIWRLKLPDWAGGPLHP